MISSKEKIFMAEKSKLTHYQPLSGALRIISNETLQGR